MTGNHEKQRRMRQLMLANPVTSGSGNIPCTTTHLAHIIPTVLAEACSTRRQGALRSETCTRNVVKLDEHSVWFRSCELILSYPSYKERYLSPENVEKATLHIFTEETPFIMGHSPACIFAKGGPKRGEFMQSSSTRYGSLFKGDAWQMFFATRVYQHASNEP